MDAIIVVVRWRVLCGRPKIAAAMRREDVSAGALVWYRIFPACVRKLAGRTLIFSGLAACNVYDPTGVELPPSSDASFHRDRDDDEVDGAGPSEDGAGGNAGGGGAEPGDVGSGGAGGQDVGSGGATGQDVRGDGSGGQEASSPDAGRDGEIDGSYAGDGASDGIGGGMGDAALDCSDDACFDGPGLDADSGIVDQCPADPAKTEPGICGCGTADTDSDTDGTADCIDGCPGDIRKTQPGVCGCNADDPADVDAGQAFCLKALLAHRYSFNGSGTVAADSIAMANGAIMGGSNASMSGGSISLSGDLGSRYTAEGYVSLPSHLLNAFTSTTLEVWLTWRGTGTSGGRNWQRIFDFGDQSGTAPDLVGKTYLFLTAQASPSGFPRAAISPNGPSNETLVTATQAIALNTQTHLAVVIDDGNDILSLYLNGSPAGSVAWTGALSAINDVNAWLGRSNYAVDPEFNGILHEFRVYRVPLNATQISASYGAGPDPAFF